jgi:hypothetical protein
MVDLSSPTSLAACPRESFIGVARSRKLRCHVLHVRVLPTVDTTVFSDKNQEKSGK